MDAIAWAAPPASRLASQLRCCLGRVWAKKVPTVAGDVTKNSDPPVRLIAGVGDELDSLSSHALIGGLEVVDAKKHPNAAGELLADRLLLGLTIGLREQKPRRCVGWSDNHPPLRPPVVSHGWRILEKLESERVNKEADPDVVVVDDDGYMLQVHDGLQTIMSLGRSDAQALRFVAIGIVLIYQSERGKRSSGPAFAFCPVPRKKQSLTQSCSMLGSRRLSGNRFRGHP